MPLGLPDVGKAVDTALKVYSTIKTARIGKKMRKEGESFYKQGKEMNAALGKSPTMEVPKSVDQYINLSRNLARQEMPGASQMRQDIAQTNASMLSSASQAGSGFDTMAAVLAAGQNRMNALRQMGIAAAQYTAGQQQQYAQAVASRAPWEQQQFEYNQWLPWQMRKNEAQDLMNTGLQMKYSGADIGAAAWTQGANMASQGLWNMQNNPNSQYWNWMNDAQAMNQARSQYGPSLSDPSIFTNLM